MEESDKRFTPSTEDIVKAETLLLSNAADVKYKDLSGVYEPGKLKGKLLRYNRQYAGYQNAEADSIILIHLLNFAKKKPAKDHFTDWRTVYITGFGDFYEKNMVTMSVNLTRKEVSIR